MRMWWSQGTWMRAETGHKDEIFSHSFGPDERFLKATFASCVRIGWLQRIDGPADDRDRYHDPEHTSYLALSDVGKRAIEGLVPADFENMPQPSVRGEAARILRALGARHERPEWVFMTEAPMYVPGRGAIHLDGLAMNCWRTKGFVTIGYEVKVSRSDFRGELKKPEKTAASAALCSAFYFAAPFGLIKPSEVPDPYGLVIVFESGKSRIAKGSKLERPAPTWGTLAFLMRRIFDEETTLEALKEAA
jgi:hypothetical protein